MLKSRLNTNSCIYISGHSGMVGSAIGKLLERKGYDRLLRPTRAELDLTNQSATFDFFAEHRPQAQIICAAIVGGIHANSTYPGDFIGQNLMIQNNLIEAARRFGCDNNLFISSSCVYPPGCVQPMKEEYLFSLPPERTNQWYAMAKIAGMKMGQAYREQFGMQFTSVLPPNLYGPADNFDLENGHVLPSLMRRFHEARLAGADSVTVWGTGKARREFAHVDDMARAVEILLRQPSEHGILNLASGKDYSIAEASEIMRRVTGFDGELVFDTSKPDGPARKLMDDSRTRQMNWKPTIELEDGLRSTYQWFCEQQDNLRILSPERGRVQAA